MHFHILSIRSQSSGRTWRSFEAKSLAGEGKILVSPHSCKTSHLEEMLRNHVSCLEWPQDLMACCKGIGQQGILVLKISPGKWSLLSNEASTKSPQDFARSDLKTNEAFQCNPGRCKAENVPTGF